MRKRILFILLLAVISVSLTVASVSAQQRVIMRVATPTTNDPQVYEMERFKELVEARSGGRIEVQLFPSSQLGTNSQMLQGLRLGTIHGLLEPTAFLGGFNDVLTVVDLPYLFDDVHQAVELLNGPTGDPLRQYLEETGLVALRFYEYGPRILLLKFPVNSIDDFRGKKIRVMGAQVLIDQINAWGGSGIPMGVPELYPALQQGTIDGLESAAQFFYSLKYHEVAPYLFMAPKGAEVTIFMANKRWLDSLPADLQQIIRQAAIDITDEANEFARRSDQEAIEAMKAEGVQVIEPSPELDAELRRRVEPVHMKFLEDNPRARPIYEAIKAAVAKE